jgi:chromosome segregation ATPase
MFAQSLPLILTLLAIGAGILINNKGLSDLKADMKDMKTELKADIAAARAEAKADIVKVEARLDKLEVRLDKLEARLDARLNSIDTSLLQFSELKGHLEGRVDEIAKRVAA